MLSAAGDTLVDAETEQGKAEARDVVHVVDNDLLVPQLDDNGATTCDIYIWILSARVTCWLQTQW